VVLPQHRPLIFLVFGAGFAAVFGVFYLLYRHAYRQRGELELNELEIFETAHSVRRFGVATLIGVGYLPLAWMQSLPTKTRSQSRLVIVVAIAVLVIFGALLMRMVWLARERRRVRAEWKARQTPAPPEEPAE
jgi:hypothetical protein